MDIDPVEALTEVFGAENVFVIEDQPMPTKSDRPNIAELVAADHLERMRVGTERYGTPLQGFNGRNALIDAYQEALDLCQYLRQKI